MAKIPLSYYEPQPAVLLLKNPYGDDLGSITVVGDESEQMLTYSIERHKKLRDKSIDQIETSEMVLESFRSMAARIVDWDVEVFGELTEENKLNTVKKHAFIRPQIQAFVDERMNFFRPNPRSTDSGDT